MHESLAMLMPGKLLDGLQSQAEGFAIRRHAFVPVTIVQIFVEPMVDLRRDGYFVRFITVVLGKNVIADRFQEASFLRTEIPHRRDVVDPVKDNFSRLRIPEFLLAKRAEAWIISWLSYRSNRFPRVWIDGARICFRTCS
jgi:hypothetical protein